MIAPHHPNSTPDPLTEASQVHSDLGEVYDRVHQFIFNRDHLGPGRFIKSTIDQALLYGLIPWSRLRGMQSTSTFGILMYHRIIPEEVSGPSPTWNVTPQQFETQLSGLLEMGFQPVSLSHAIKLTSANQSLPDNSFIVTFDDGYANNFEYALPILKKLKVPVTIFLSTAYLDSLSPFPSDDWDQAGKAAPISWRALNFAECHELLDSGLVELGSHTHTHDDFRNRPEDLKNDILQSQSELEHKLGIKSPSFAFPFGTRKLGFSSDELIEAARSTGVTCSLSTEHQMVTPDQSPFEWGRFPAYQSDSAQTLAVKLSGWYSTAKNKLKKS